MKLKSTLFKQYIAITILGLLVLSHILYDIFDDTTSTNFPTNASSGNSAYSFYQLMSFYNSSEVRMKAAAQFPSIPGSSPWIVWILTSDNPFLRSIQDDTTKALDNAVIVAMIKSIRSENSPEIFLALTSQLNNHMPGQWSRVVTNLIAKRIEDGHTEPVSDVARKCLKDILGQDYGSNIDDWRIAIKEMIEQQKTINKN